MSLIIMKIIIKENEFKLIIKKKMSKLVKEDIIKIFSILESFKKLEIKKGNEYEHGWIKLTYLKEMKTSEYINIFKLVRNPILYDFLSYFLTINENFNKQSTDTKINLDDYIESMEETSQEIIIIMVFKITTKHNQIEKKSKKIENFILKTYMSSEDE